MIRLVSICTSKDGRLMFFRQAFGLSSAHCASSAVVNVIGLATCGKLMFLGKP